MNKTNNQSKKKGKDLPSGRNKVAQKTGPAKGGKALAPEALESASKSSSRNAVLQALYNDHRNISKTLQAFDDQIILYKEGSAANFKLMKAVMTYLVQAPDQYHHPFEERLFALLAGKKPSLMEAIDHTTQEHNIIKQAGESVLACLEDQLRSPGMIKEAHVVERGEAYISILRAHIKHEEDLLFRQGDKLLSEEEWVGLASILEANPEDPLFDDKSNASFDFLRSHFRQRVDAIVEKYNEKQVIPVYEFKSTMVNLSATSGEIGRLVVKGVTLI